MIAVFCSFCVISSVNAAEKVFNLKGSTFIPPSGARWDNVTDFMAKLKERTNGRVNLTVSPSGGLAPGQEEYDYLSRGLFDFGQPSSGWVSAYHNEFGLTMCALMEAENIPVLMKSEAFKILSEIAAKDNIKLLGYWASIGYNSHSHKTKFFKKLSDYDGVRFFASGAPHDKIHQLIGAKTVPIPNAELFSAYQSGLIDSVSTSISAQKSFRFYEIAPYMTIFPRTKNLGIFGYMPMMSMKTWNSLPPDIQDIIMKTAEEITELSVERWRKSDRVDTLEFFKASDRVKVYELTDPEADAIIEHVQKPIQEWYVERGKGKGREKELLAIAEKFLK